MAGKNTAAFGIFQTRAQTEACVDALVANGFRVEDISVLMSDNVGTKDFAHQKNTKAPEGTTTGVVAGGIAGGTVGLLVGLGALTIPGLGPLLAAATRRTPGGSIPNRRAPEYQLSATIAMPPRHVCLSEEDK